MIHITDKQDCMGCYACATICPTRCITMKSDSEGFWYPEVRVEDCIHCGKCISVCPIIQKKSQKTDSGIDPLAYAAYNQDLATRLESSSGGIFTLIAECVLQAGGVVFGARFDDGFNVFHDYVEGVEDLDVLRGSKYVQSKIGNSYRYVERFLEQGRLVLFTGTPCQISGLRYYLGKNYDNLVLQDIICHGVPSPKVWQKYVAFRENRAGASTKRIAFRRKDKGWKRFSISFLFNNDMEYRQILTQDLYMRAFLRNICLRPSCHACHFKTVNRTSDITLADFWGAQYVLRDMDDDKGTSFLVIHSEKGKQLLERLADKMVYQQVDVWQGIKYNTAMVKSAIAHPRREEFFRSLDHETVDRSINRLCADKFRARLRSKAVSIIRSLLIRMGLFEQVQRVVGKGP